jgi:iron complex outermembrane receptor protein
MKALFGQRSIRHTSGRAFFKLHPVAAGCTALLMASSVMAQQTTDLDTVTVTGIRAAIESAISVKKNSDSIVEAISSEDLGKLPDVSIADSIARLPGVAAQRNNEGRASQLSVRGMPPDFSTTLLNGREQVNPNDSRGAEFDAYPGELMNGVVLYKTPDSTLMGQGIAGTIDLQTVRPLSVGGRKVTFGLNKQQTSVGLGPSGSGDNFSFSYVDQFLDKTLGIALGLSRKSGDSTGRGVNSFDDSGKAFGDGTLLPLRNSVTELSRTSKYTQDGVMAVVEFKPSKNFTSTLDLFSSTADRRTLGHQVAFPKFNEGTTLSNATIVNGVALAGTVSGVNGIVQTIGQQQNDDNTAFGWNNKFKLNDQWSGVVDLSQSKSKRTEIDIDSNAITGTPGNLTFDSRTSIPTFSFSGNLADTNTLLLGNTPWGMGWLKKPSVNDGMDSIRAELKRSLDNPYFSAFNFGMNYSDRSKVLGMTEGSLAFKSGAATSTLPSSSVVNAGMPGINVLGWDSIALIDSTYQYTDMGDQSWAKMKNWSVKEKVTTSFAKLDIDSSVGKIPLRGNVGLQVVKTDQSSTGASSTTVGEWGYPDGNHMILANGANKTDGKTYTDVLPNLNLVADVGNSQVVRFGLGKMMARPTMRDLRANSVFECWSPNTDTKSCSGNHSASGGNPLLEPFRATTLDIAYEKYFGKRAYVGAAAFYKDLDTFIYQQSFKVDALSQFGLAGYPMLDYSGPMNGKGGTISGFEVTANAPFDLLTPVLSGFGAYINYSDTHSSVNIPNSAGGSSANMDLPGLSKQVTNLSVYYEKDGFSARVGQRTRSDFIGEFTDNQYERKLTYVKGESIVDLQIGYEFKSGSAKGLTLTFQANNVGDAVFQKYVLNADGAHETTESAKYGKTYIFGANYKF